MSVNELHAVRPFEKASCTLGEETIRYRHSLDNCYCTAPADEIQKINIFVPEAYFEGQSVNGYTKETAPVFMPNTVGGYMPGPADAPGMDSHTNQINSIFRALQHGYVAASAGVRGRTSGKVSLEFFEGGNADYRGSVTGKMVGRAPALIVDMKAAIRYLRHFSDQIPGNMERIVTNGTSAGGALSALAGSSGNSTDYIPYLEKIGAYKERDDVFAASCYCPIHNLEHADMAYEWQFQGINDYHRTKKIKTADGLVRTADDGVMSQEQIRFSAELASEFPSYVNSLGLQSGERKLCLDRQGKGTFLDFLCQELVKSAQRELDTHESSGQLSWLAAAGSAVETLSCLQIRDDRAVSVDWRGYIRTITRMKQTPAFDALDLKSPENEEFGDEHCDGRHFTDFSYSHSAVHGEKASDAVIRMMNPLTYIREEGVSQPAQHWRIRHGTFDRDTSLAIPAILALSLKQRGLDVDFRYPWGLPHSGDYDLEELFAWIDSVCR